MKVILASGSPRRKELLKLIYDDFEIVNTDVEETCPDNIELSKLSLYLSEIKAKAAAKDHSEDIIIAADTTVSLDDSLLGKPHSPEEAKLMLKMLSGKIHKVITGVTVLTPKLEISVNAETVVEFYELTDEEINSYVATGEPLDKAGAYGIQGRAAKFVKMIQGDYNNVVGLPVAALYQALKSQKLV